MRQAADLARKNDLKQAEQAYRSALEGCADAPASASDAWVGLAQIAQRGKRHDEAQEAYRRAVELRRQTDDPAALAAILNLVAEFHRTQGAYDLAEPLYREALAVRERHLGADHLHTALSLNNLGLLLFKQGHYTEAEQVLRRALEIKQQHLGEEAPGLTTSLNNLALVYTQSGEYAKAAPLHERALRIRERELPPEHPDIARSLNNLALLYNRLGDYERAETLYRRALQVREKVFGPDHPDVANTLHSLALVYQERKQYAQAEELYQRAIEIWRAAYGENYPDLAISLNNLAALARAQDDLPRAEALYQHALAIQKQQLGEAHPATATSLGNLAFMYTEAKSWEQAESLYLHALHVGIEHRAPERLWIIQHNFSDHLQRQDVYSTAIIFGKMAVNSLQGLRLEIHEMEESLRKSFLENKTQVYEQLANLLMLQQRLIEAQEVLAMLKEEQYFDFVARDENADIRVIQASYTAQEQAFVQAWERRHAQLTELQKHLRQATEKSRKTELQQKLSAAWDDLQALVDRYKEQDTQAPQSATPSPSADRTGIDAQALLAQLGPHAALLHYLPTGERLQILLTSSNGRSSHSARVSRSELDRAILEFHSALQDPRQVPLESAQRLYGWLLEPVAEALAGKEVLMISLTGLLHYIPVAALYDGEHYVAERFAVARYTEAARQTLGQEARPEGRAAGFGLTRAVEGFSSLPGVAAELHSIVREGPQDSGVFEGRIYLDDDFTLAALRRTLEEKYGLLHIASHFVFEPGTEETSFLLLGDGTKLSLAQVRTDLGFHGLELLTLSACDTATGAAGSRGGEEIEGFGVLAQRQGAKGVLASLWPVNDASTAHFMEYFYTRRATENLSKAAALQATQRAFIAAAREQDGKFPYFYARPYYWAGFILMGNWL